MSGYRTTTASALFLRVMSNANGYDHLTEMNDENVFSRTNGDGSCGRENGGETLSSTVSGVVTCHEKMSLRTESDLYNTNIESPPDRGGRWIDELSCSTEADRRKCSALWLETEILLKSLLVCPTIDLGIFNDSE